MVSERGSPYCVPSGVCLTCSYTDHVHSHSLDAVFGPLTGGRSHLTGRPPWTFARARHWNLLSLSVPHHALSSLTPQSSAPPGRNSYHIHSCLYLPHPPLVDSRFRNAWTSLCLLLTSVPRLCQIQEQAHNKCATWINLDKNLVLGVQDTIFLIFRTISIQKYSL